MNATTAITAEQYLARVRAALADLPTDEREELLEDLPAHLADVAAESDGALEERLGTPEEYAAELRASAGLAPAGQPAQAGFGRRYGDFKAAMDQWPAWQRFRAFAPLLRPGWWVLRGYLVALAIAAAIMDVRHYGVSLAPDDDLLVFLPFAVLTIWASVWLGKRSEGWRGARRAVIYGFNALVVIVALGMSTVVASPDVEQAYPGSASPLDSAEDIYVYDRNGQPLHDVRLFDQWGNPIELPGWTKRDWMRDGGLPNVYPRGRYGMEQGEFSYAPNAEPPPSIPPLPSPPADETQPTPSGSASPSVSPSPAPTR